MKNVRTILAAAVLGVSAIALPPAHADEFKKTQIDDIPREARDAIKNQTKDKDDVQVFSRHMDGGETQYTAFYMDGGRRMEFRVDKDGKVTSPAHETREQPGDKDKDKDRADKDKDRDKDMKRDSSADSDKAYQRESTSLAEIPKPAQDALNEEMQKAKAKEGDYFRLRQQGDDIYSMFYTPEGGQAREVRVDKNGKVLGHFGGGESGDGAVAKTPSEDAAQPAGARQQPADTSAGKTTQTPQPAPKTPAPATPAPAEATELREIKADELPKPVAEAFKNATFSATQVEYRTWTRDGKTYYSAFYLPKGGIKQMEFRTDAEGKPLEDAHEAQPKK